MTTPDIIDTLAGIKPGSALDAIRAKRLQARENAQKSYLSLFEPIDAGGFSLLERAAVATFVTGLHGESPVASFYRDKLAASAGGRARWPSSKTDSGRGSVSRSAPSARSSPWPLHDGSARPRWSSSATSSP